jgi:hypothetical protein
MKLDLRAERRLCGCVPRHTYIRGVQVPGQRINSEEDGYQGINIAVLEAENKASNKCQYYSRIRQTTLLILRKLDLMDPYLKLPVSKDKELLSVLRQPLIFLVLLIRVYYRFMLCKRAKSACKC